VSRYQCQPSYSFSRRLVLLLSAILLVMLTNGCNDLRQRAVALWPFGPAATPLPQENPISVLGWTGSEAENNQLQQAISAFEQAHPTSPVAGSLIPDYSVALNDELASATPPDLFLVYSHQLADLVKEGKILPIPPNYPVANAIAPNLAAGIQVDGQNYCFPRDVAVLVLFYNPALFDRGQAPYPQNTWGWAEFRAALDATGDMNNGFYGLVEDYDLSRFLPFLLQSNKDNDLWQGDDALTALEYYMAFYNDEVATIPARLDSTWNGEAFGKGHAAMTIEGNWLVGYLANQFPSLTYATAELPTGPTGRGTTAFISCWVVNAKSQNRAAALELAAFLTSPEQITAWADVSGNLPPTLDRAAAWVANHPKYATFGTAMAYAAPWTGPAGFIKQSETVNLSMSMWYKDNMTTPELLGVLQTMSQNPPLPTPTATPSD
jgi:multiple sugar transport system substrate-binding protein